MKETYLKIAFVVCLTLIAIIMAMIQPAQAAPDEGMKMIIIDYMSETGELPRGDNPEILDDVWGTSYGFTPYIPYIIGASFEIIAKNFTQDAQVLYRIARIPSIVFYLFTVILIIKIADKLFENKKIKGVFIVLFTTFPSIVFTGSYINIDMFAIFTNCFIVYAWLEGLYPDKCVYSENVVVEEKKNKKEKKKSLNKKQEQLSENNKIWSTKACILLGISIGLCALSYYNAFGFILTSIIIFYATAIKKLSGKLIFQKTLIIAGIALLLGGWFYVRNAILYDGDFLAFNISEEVSEKYAQENFKPSQKYLPAKEHLGIYEFFIVTRWLYTTLITFIAAYGQLFDLRAFVYTYGFYIFVAVIAVIGYFARFIKFKQIKEWKQDKNKLVLDICMILNMIIPFLLAIYYSYFSDYQPQGRYILPLALPMMYFVTLGLSTWTNMIKNKKAQNITIAIFLVATVLALACFVIPIVDHFG